VRPLRKLVGLHPHTKKLCWDSLASCHRHAFPQLYLDGTGSHAEAQSIWTKAGIRSAQDVLGVLPQGRRPKIPPISRTEEPAIYKRCKASVSIASPTSIRLLSVVPRQSAGEMSGPPRPAPSSSIADPSTQPPCRPLPPVHSAPASLLPTQQLQWGISTCPAALRLTSATSLSPRRSGTESISLNPAP
jgi:hypothetical protein